MTWASACIDPVRKNLVLRNVYICQGLIILQMIIDIIVFGLLKPAYE